MIAMITDPLVIRKFLLHLKLPPDPLPIAPARARAVGAPLIEPSAATPALEARRAVTPSQPSPPPADRGVQAQVVASEAHSVALRGA